MRRVVTHNVHPSRLSYILDGLKADPYQDAFRRILSDKGRGSGTIGRYAIVSRNLDLLRFWLQCCQTASRMKIDSNETPFCGISTWDFKYALEHGLTEELSVMIKTIGAELPLDALVKQSGVQQDEKPKYYQGLSIGGKKMTKWAQGRGGRRYQEAVSESTPPLLRAAYEGGLIAVEWFLSDTPFRLYKEYGMNNPNNQHLKTLAKAHGGLDKAISSWLQQRSIVTHHPLHLEHER